jgi:hypothetical protein
VILRSSIFPRRERLRCIFAVRPLLLLLGSVCLSTAAEFESARQLSSYSGYVEQLIPADLDGDGDMDLVTGGYYAQTVTWYENRGRGVFSMRGFWEGTSQEEALRGVADFDGDGLPDLLLGSSEDGSYQLRILFGAGFDGFGPRQKELAELAEEDFFLGPVVRDVDGNGSPDVVTDGTTLLDPGKQNPVKVESGSSQVHFTQFSAEDLSWEDWSGDGLPDVIHRNGAWWENLGGGKFSDYKEFSFGSRWVTGLRVLRDSRLPGGRALLAVVDDVSDDVSRPELHLLVEDGSEGFTELDSIPLGSGRDGWSFHGFSRQQVEGEPLLASIQNVQVTDDPEDPRLESEVMEISLHARGDTLSLAMKRVVRVSSPAGPMVLADMDADGRRDLFLQAAPLPGTVDYHGGGTLMCHRGNNTGGFRQKPDLVSSPFTGDQVKQLADFDGDGDLDLLTEAHDPSGRESEISVWLNRDHASSFVRKTILSSKGDLRLLSAKDRNGDRRADIVASIFSWGSRAGGDDRVVMSLSSRGGPRRVVTIASDTGEKMWYRGEMGDWDGDGVDDLLIWETEFPEADGEDYQFPVRWAKGLGKNAFGELQPLGESANEAMYDADGDGDLDLVPSNSWAFTYPDFYKWRENVGGGSQPMVREFLANPGDSESRLDLVAAGADLNLDGRMDFLRANVPVLSQENGGFTMLPPLPAGTTTFHDVDGDGDADAMVVIPASPHYSDLTSLVWLENLGGAVFSEPRELEGPTWGDHGSRPLHVGDLNGDGITDIVSSAERGRPRIDLFLGKPD